MITTGAMEFINYCVFCQKHLLLCSPNFGKSTQCTNIRKYYSADLNIKYFVHIGNKEKLSWSYNTLRALPFELHNLNIL